MDEIGLVVRDRSWSVFGVRFTVTRAGAAAHFLKLASLSWRCTLCGHRESGYVAADEPVRTSIALVRRHRKAVCEHVFNVTTPSLVLES